MDLNSLLIPIELLQSDNEQSDNEQSGNEQPNNELFDFEQLDFEQLDIEQSNIEQSDIEQSDIEQSDIRDCYETSDDYETTNDKYSNNSLVVSEKHILKKKQNHGMNSKTILEKQTELANYPDVLEVLGPLCVRCKHCKKLIKLKRNYDKSRIESYVSNSKCIKNKEFQYLEKFFSASNPQDKPLHKRYPCSSLCKTKHLKYIEQVGGFITFGGAPPINKVAKELFPFRFPNKTKFSYSKLTPDQSRRLNDELSAKSKWKIGQKCLCIRSSVCETYTDQIGRICVKCILLTKNQVFNVKTSIIRIPFFILL
ncbi:hypothetical protein C2G38_2044533 [Gigaspora rosea]|uniref:Uncharacterized protein n=1 Tax=Gigaspora rosea TaxID=44941 RepID=A0A397UFX1_9GLOM|nr:hypothetical protein C2G38_2044533 [Gigaspora rosea]